MFQFVFSSSYLIMNNAEIPGSQSQFASAINLQNSRAVFMQAKTNIRTSVYKMLAVDKIFMCQTAVGYLILVAIETVEW